MAATGTATEPGDSRRSLGRRGERLAAAHLKRAGLTVLEANWRCREGELDLLATDGRMLVVCEVKTRSGAACGDGEESVTAAKAARIRRLANRWLCARRVQWCRVRFDVIAVTLPEDGRPELRHIEGAF
ncbi:YraN family protein [Amycolatopsis suaedae]|uniref:UPF0102 protein EWH70_07920 n=1 Tax=Amycolatopsis suaedae TaxID=2510978 RepID=A0A4Q7JDS4_9PSEU|nr:YraN family protein [Amycolatopsis suaedae]RZQ64803.1 YraN family protein [Amycolatopsis suaedae]